MMLPFIGSFFFKMVKHWNVIVWDYIIRYHPCTVWFIISCLNPPIYTYKKYFHHTASHGIGVHCIDDIFTDLRSLKIPILYIWSVDVGLHTLWMNCHVTMSVSSTLPGNPLCRWLSFVCWSGCDIITWLCPICFYHMLLPLLMKLDKL